MRLKITLGILVILVLIIFSALYFYFQEKKAIATIQTFEECKENGFPIQESYPARCMTPDGRSFVEQVVVNGQDIHTNLIQVEYPKPGETIKSPIVLKGQARGYWFFEASFPVELLDSHGKTLVQKSAQAQDDWMTENFVPFLVTLNFTSTTSQSAVIVLHRDNPSGLPENDDSISIPVVISPN